MTDATIAHVRWRRVAVPLRAVVATSSTAQAVRESVLWEIIDDDRNRGVGETALPPSSSFAADGDAIEGALHGMAADSLGRTTDEVWSSTSPGSPVHAKAWAGALSCGFETAIADLAARRLGEPLYAWLARTAGLPPGTPAFEANGLIDMTGPALAAERARSLASDGYRTIKMKVGGNPTAALAAVSAVRRELGPTVALRCDANRAWDYADAEQFLKGAEACQVALCEEPLREPGEDFRELARLRQDSIVPIAVDESARTLGAIVRAIEAGAGSAYVIKPMASGLRESLAMIAMLRAAGLPTIVTTTFDLAAGTALAMHVAALAGSPPPACGVATLPLVVQALGTGVPGVVQGRVSLGAERGLGVSLDHAAIERAALSAWQEVCR